MEMNQEPIWLRSIKCAFGVLAFFPTWALLAITFGISGLVWDIAILRYSAILIAGSSFVACTCFVGYTAFSSSQWRILELLSTLVVGTLPAAIWIQSKTLTVNFIGWDELTLLLLYLIAGQWITFTASFIGMNWIRSVNEQRTANRMAMLVLSWSAVVSIGATFVGLGCFAMVVFGKAELFSSQNFKNWEYGILLCATLLVWIPIRIVDNRYRAIRGHDVQY